MEKIYMHNVSRLILLALAMLVTVSVCPQNSPTAEFNGKKAAKRLISSGWIAEPGMPDMRQQLENLNAMENGGYRKLEGNGEGKTFYEAYTMALVEALKNNCWASCKGHIAVDSLEDLLFDEHFGSVFSGELSVSFRCTIDDDKYDQTLSYSVEGTNNVVEKSGNSSYSYNANSEGLEKVMSIYRVTEFGLVECVLVLMKKAEE